MTPSTPSRKAIIPPPPPPTPKTPSNALVVRRPSGPLVPTMPFRSSSSSNNQSSNSLSVAVKRENNSFSGPVTPSRVLTTRTPPSTSLVRRSRSITPSPRRRRASSTPSRSRAPVLSSSSAFKAKLAELRSKASTRRFHLPESGSSNRPARNRSATVEDGEDDDEVEFWGGGKIKGSAADVAIEIDADSDDSSPSPSPTPSIRGTVENRTLVRPTPFTDRAGTEPGPSKDERSDRAESTFSLASFGSRGTPFLRAPTWDDSDQRYGRTYPKDGPPREVAPTAPTSFPLSSPMPLPLTSAIGKMSDLILSFQPKIPEEDIKRGHEERCVMSHEEKLGIVMESYFSDEVTHYDDELMKRLQDRLAADDISLSTFDLSSTIKFFKSTVHQSLKSSINEYRAEQSYKGNKEVRQNLWFRDFKVYLKFATPTLGDRISKETMETILLYLQVALNEKNAMKHIVARLEDKFDDCNNPKILKLLDAMIDLCAAIVNIAFAK